jgi:uncharacterized membrane protein (DUF2068 family)
MSEARVASEAVRVEALSRHADPLLILIGAFKVLKALLLLLVALGAHHLIHRSVYEFAMHVLHHIRADPENRHIHRFLQMTLSIKDHQLRELELGTMIYGALFLTEGLGLILQKHWAEWMAVISTSLLIPLEIHEILKRHTALRIGLFVFNIAVVLYLIYKIRRDARRRKAAQAVTIATAVTGD